MSTKAGPIRRRVLLFSGGLDSVCYAQILRPDVLLYVPSGARYQQKEDDAVEAVAEQLPGTLVILRGAVNLADIARPDAIVPGRNAFLALLASNYGDTIWLGKASSDRQGDSGTDFCRAMEATLNAAWSRQFWCNERKFEVSTPLAHMSKTELVRGFLEAGGKPRTLLDSRSCYDPEHDQCGICKPCMHKRIALFRNGIRTPPGYWAFGAFHAPWGSWARMLLEPTIYKRY